MEEKLIFLLPQKKKPGYLLQERKFASFTANPPLSLAKYSFGNKSQTETEKLEKNLFIDRFREVAELCFVFAQNLDEPNNRYTLPITAQMFGQGKSMLGRHVQQYGRNIFDDEFTRNEEKKRSRGIMTAKIGSEKDLKAFFDAQYVLLDFSDFVRTYNSSEQFFLEFRAFLFRRIAEETRLMKDPDVLNIINGPLQNMDIETPQKIFEFFAKKINRRIFLHIDEVQSLNSMLEIDGTPLTKFYAFWKEIHNGLSNDFIYVSGRSIWLYNVGKQYLPSTPSPGRIFLVKMSTFSKENIAELFDLVLGQRGVSEAFDFEKRNQIIQVLHRLTAGVPRLVQVAMMVVLRTNNIKEINSNPCLDIFRSIFDQINL